jgi:light-harvesting complex I chlorophyll a/b binding protein 1
MKSAAVALALASGASAFVAPSAFNGRAVARIETSSALKMADASAIEGKPFGDETIFDPLGLAEKATDADLKKYQEAELKHGRVAMLAVLGSLIQENFHPLFDLGQDIGPSIRHFQLIENSVPWFWEATLFVIGLFEANNIIKGWQQQDVYREGIADLKEDYTVGDLGFDPLNLNNGDNFEELRTKELNNGRLAMIAIFGLWAQELVDGKEILTHWSS